MTTRVDPEGSGELLWEVLAAYFEAADRGSPTARRELTARHPDLANELNDFLDDHERLLRLTAQPVAPPRLPAVGRDAGERIRVAGLGAYELLGEIGRGGMGVIYRARQHGLNRLVALKVMLGGDPSADDDLRRFRREAEAVAALDHPNIVPVFEVGEHDGRGFFSMKLIEEGSLAERSAEFRDPTRAARIVAKAARAVQHAHERGILHRDLKPANILVDAQGEPYLTDFGLAKRAGVDPGLTLARAVLGTPCYMAPEQAGGGESGETTRTDVYGLGAILYALLTGGPPFRGDSVLATLELVRERPPAPLGPTVDRDLETVCLTCLAKEPARRYESAEAVATDLERWLQGEPIRARQIGPAARFRRWCRHHRRWVASALASAMLIVLAGVSVRQNAQLRDARERAARRAKELQSHESAALAVRYALDVRLASQLLRSGQGEAAGALLDAHRPGPSRDDPREFAWGHLLAALHRERATLNGHVGEVYHAEFAPDGRTLATCGADRTVRLWDVASLRARAVLRGHTDEVNWVAFAPDGQTLASASDDRTVRVWDADTGSCRVAFEQHSRAVVALSFSPDGRYVISGGRDGRVRRWEAATAREVASWESGVGEVESLALASEGTTLAVAGRSPFVRLFDGCTGRPRGAAGDPTVRGRFEYVAGVALSRDGRVVAATAEGARAALWDENGRRAVLHGHHAQVVSLALTPDGRLLATAGRDAAVALWDVATGQPRGFLSGHSGRLWCVAFAPDGRTLVTAGGEGVAKLWDLDSWPDRSARLIQPSPVQSLAFTSDGASVATSAADGAVRVWDAASGRPVGTPFAAQGPLGRFSWLAPRAETLAVLDADARAITLHDLRAVRKPVRLGSVEPLRGFVAFSPDGGRFVTQGRDHVKVWDVADGREVGRLTGPSPFGDVLPVFDPSGAVVVAENFSRLKSEAWLASWDVRTGRRLLDIPGLSTSGSLAVAPRGGGVARAHGPAIELRDAATLQKRITLLGHTDQVNALDFSPDGRTLASGGSDKVVRLWHVATGTELLSLEGHTGPVYQVRFSPDGRTLATSADSLTGGGEVLIWHALRPPRP